MKSNDTQYKDGYQVEEGGDYIVRAFDPLKTKKSDKHLVLRASHFVLLHIRVYPW